jgi:hypothetical protein
MVLALTFIIKRITDMTKVETTLEVDTLRQDASRQPDLRELSAAELDIVAGGGSLISNHQFKSFFNAQFKSSFNGNLIAIG